jgi:hypothetical protein
MPAFAGMTAEARAMGHSFRRLVLDIVKSGLIAASFDDIAC